VFTNLTAETGGALYLDHPQSFIVSNCTFKNLTALNGTGLNDMQGVGGAIFYSCSFYEPNCALSVDASFSHNYASVKGGAIHWDYNEPVWGRSVSFEENHAGWYGDSISCYAQ
jgi:hypothetical protein